MFRAKIVLTIIISLALQPLVLIWNMGNPAVAQAASPVYKFESSYFSYEAKDGDQYASLVHTFQREDGKVEKRLYVKAFGQSTTYIVGNGAPPGQQYAQVTKYRYVKDGTLKGSTITAFPINNGFFKDKLFAVGIVVGSGGDFSIFDSTKDVKGEPFALTDKINGEPYIVQLGQYLRSGHKNDIPVKTNNSALASPITRACQSRLLKGPVSQNKPPDYQNLVNALKIMGASPLSKAMDQEAYDIVYRETDSPISNRHFANINNTVAPGLTYYQNNMQEFSQFVNIANMDIHKLDITLIPDWVPFVRGEKNVELDRNTTILGISSLYITGTAILKWGAITDWFSSTYSSVLTKGAVTEAIEGSAATAESAGVDMAEIVINMKKAQDAASAGKTLSNPLAKIIEQGKDIKASLGNNIDNVRKFISKENITRYGIGGAIIYGAMHSPQIASGILDLIGKGTALKIDSGAREPFAKATYAKYYVEKHLQYHQCILDNMPKGTPAQQQTLQVAGFTQAIFEKEIQQLLSAQSEIAQDVSSFFDRQREAGTLLGKTKCPLASGNLFYNTTVAEPICGVLDYVVRGAASFAHWVFSEFFQRALQIQ